MSTDVKQRKRAQAKKQSAAEQTEASSTTCRNDAVKTEEVHNSKPNNKSSAARDVKSLICAFLFAVCGALSWAVMQQNERFSQMEEKYKFLHEKTSSLLTMEEDIIKVSEKLTASEDDLHDALSTVSMATRLQQDIAGLHATVMAMQADENSASRDLQAVNAHFLNVTETWQEKLAAVTSNLSALKAESRESHAAATERVNEAERRARLLAEKLKELEDSTTRNSRALDRTEEEDVNRAQAQLDWNTKQVHKLEEQILSLTKREAELSSQLEEHIPRAQECEKHLPQVEEAVLSILKLSGDLSGAEKRLEEVTLQVFGAEDSMLKALNEILHIRQELDSLHAQNSILKMKNELSVIKEAVRELTSVLRESRAESLEGSDTLDVGEWDDEEEEWQEEDLKQITEPPSD